jgi:hypothetical protein
VSSEASASMLNGPEVIRSSASAAAAFRAKRELIASKASHLAGGSVSQACSFVSAACDLRAPSTAYDAFYALSANAMR